MLTDGQDAVAVTLPIDDPAFRGARKISGILKKAGYEAWLAGGSVRDLLMGLTPHDWDIATSAPPGNVLALFDRTIPVGVQFGVVIVRMGGFDYEVATFRADCGYSDGRRPDDIRFTDLREDVLRRDFTMNGLVLDADTGELVDLVGGIEDIRKGVIRAIGMPAARFEEDRLRQMRAIRFAAQTGFGIEPLTLRAITENAPHIVQVSGERISEEYRKLLQARDPSSGFRLAVQTGLLKWTIPELSGRADTSVIEKMLDLLRGSELHLMWAAVLEQIGPDEAAMILKRLKRSNQLCDAVRMVLEDARDAAGLPMADVAAEKRLVRRPFFRDGLQLLEARLTLAGEGRQPVDAGLERLGRWTALDLHPTPIISGNDVVAAGVARGPRIAAVLESIEDEQLRGTMTTREQALEYIRALPRVG